MVGGERRAVVMRGEEDVVAIEVGQRHVGRESRLGVDDDELRGRLRLHAAEHFAQGNAGEDVVELRPARDAVDVAAHVDARQRHHLAHRPLRRCVDEAEGAEGPLREVDVGDRAVVQDRPALRLHLAGREARGAHVGSIGRTDTILHLSPRPTRARTKAGRRKGGKGQRQFPCFFSVFQPSSPATPVNSRSKGGRARRRPALRATFSPLRRGGLRRPAADRRQRRGDGDDLQMESERFDGAGVSKSSTRRRQTLSRRERVVAERLSPRPPSWQSTQLRGGVRGQGFVHALQRGTRRP